jgi:hypothetical protein
MTLAFALAGAAVIALDSLLFTSCTLATFLHRLENANEEFLFLQTTLFDGQPVRAKITG